MKRRLSVAVLMGAAVVVGVLGPAWACTGQPKVFSVSPLTAPVGAEVRMRGEAVAVAKPVELRWNGVAGPKLAEVTADSRAGFELAFTVPDVEPGVYSLVLVTDNGGTVAVGRSTFEVSGARASASAGSGFAAATEAAGLDSSAGVGSSTAMLAGVGLLAFGSVALLGGFAVAALRRRPAPVPGSSERRSG